MRTVTSLPVGMLWAMCTELLCGSVWSTCRLETILDLIIVQ